MAEGGAPLRILVLGRGKTGSAVAEAAQERGHAVTVLGADENAGGRAIARYAATVDVAIDFTAPAAVLPNLRALLQNRVRVVVGTTGWYDSLPEVQALAGASEGRLLYGTNFSLGVQAFLRAARVLAAALPAYSMRIEETHHVTKKDAPSGTALTLQRAVAAAAGIAPPPVASHREGDAAGLHVLTLQSPAETLTLTHEAFSRRGFAAGAVRAAEWLAAQQGIGVWDFAEVAPQL